MCTRFSYFHFILVKMYYYNSIFHFLSFQVSAAEINRLLEKHRPKTGDVLTSSPIPSTSGPCEHVPGPNRQVTPVDDVGGWTEPSCLTTTTTTTTTTITCADVRSVRTRPTVNTLSTFTIGPSTTGGIRLRVYSEALEQPIGYGYCSHGMGM